MKRTLFAVGVFLILFALASLCEAGDVETKKSKGITISGEIKLDAVFSNREANTVIYGLTGPLFIHVRPHTRIPAGSRRRSSTFADPTITLNFDIWLAKQVDARLTLKTPEYMQDDIGTSSRTVNTPAGTTNFPSRTLEIDEAYVKIKEFGYKELSLVLGIQNIIYDFRGDDNPFFLAIGRSEDAFSDTFQPLGNGQLELNGPGLAGTVEAGGAKLTYSKKGERLQFTGDMIFATTVETRQDDTDTELCALVGTIAVPHAKDYKAKLMMTLATMARTHTTRLWTLGFGATVKATDALELFTEGYGQTGIYWDDYDPTDPADPANLSNRKRSILQQAFGGYTGFKYTAVNNPWRWYFGAEWWWISGDPDRTDRKQQNFISYEDVDDTIILEENNYGYDLDTNYSAIKCRAGFKPGRDLEFGLLYGNFRTARSIKWQSATNRGYDKIGDELDIQFKWDYTEDTTFRAGVGFLWNADFFNPVLKNSKTHKVAFFEAVLRF